MASILVTGASRGIGLEFVKQLLDAGHQLFACCRSPNKAEGLHNISSQNLHVHKLDVTNDDDITALKNSMQGEPLDILINNAGIFGKNQQLETMTRADWQLEMMTNVAGPALITQALLKNIRAGKDKKLIYMSSGLASISTNTTGRRLVYRSSKAALNALVKSLSIELETEGCTVAALDPGWVKTDMGGEQATTHVQDSVKGLITEIMKLTPADSGCFLSHRGETRAW